MGTTLNPRKALAQAIEANAEALAAMHHAELTLQKAHDLHCAMLAKKAEAFGNLDNQLASARAHLIKQALDSGDKDEARLMLTQPVEGFVSAQIACSQLADQIAGIEDSLPILERELVEARKAAEVADYNLDCARAAVFAAEAEALATEFLQRLHDLRHVSIELAAMSMRQMRRNPSVQRSDGPYYGQGSNTIAMPRVVLDAVTEEIMGSYDRRNPPHKKNAIAQKVNAYWSALRTDPNATLDPETKEGLFPSSVSESAAEVSLSAAE